MLFYYRALHITLWDALLFGRFAQLWCFLNGSSCTSLGFLRGLKRFEHKRNACFSSRGSSTTQCLLNFLGFPRENRSR